jgi:hypothetical protein
MAKKITITSGICRLCIAYMFIYCHNPYTKITAEFDGYDAHTGR